MGQTEMQHVCLKCRSLLADGDSCGHPRHLRVDLADADQVRRAAAKVFRSSAPETEAHVVAKQRIVPIAVGEDPVDRDDDAPLGRGSRWAGGQLKSGAFFAGMMAVGFVATAIGFPWSVPFVAACFALCVGVPIVHRLWTPNSEALQIPVHRTKVLAAPERVFGVIAERPSGAGAVTGRVVDGGGLEAPASRSPCCAFRLELHHQQATPGTLMLQYVAASRLDIRLDDGRLVRIAAGRVELAPVPGVTSNTRGIERFLERLVGNDSALFTHDLIRERVLLVGDRVSVDCELVKGARIVDETAPFRGHMTELWVASGIPALTVLD